MALQVSGVIETGKYAPAPKPAAVKGGLHQVQSPRFPHPSFAKQRPNASNDAPSG